MIPDTEPHILTGEVFGHATDFLVEQKREGDQIELTITSVLPVVHWDGRQLISFKPPSWPWPNVP